MLGLVLTDHHRVHGEKSNFFNPSYGQNSVRKRSYKLWKAVCLKEKVIFCVLKPELENNPLQYFDQILDLALLKSGSSCAVVLGLSCCII